MTPRVSIVMPVLDVERSVDSAIRSLVLQTMPDWELVVLDDGSSDATAEILRGWAAADTRIRPVVDGRRRGISARLNEGVGRARAPLVARMDGDDVCYPDRLDVQVRHLDAAAEVDLVGGAMMVFAAGGAARGVRSGPTTHEALTARAENGVGMGHPTWTGRAGWFRSHPYRAAADGFEDQEVLLRGAATSRYANVPDIVLGYREEGIKLRRGLRTRRAHAVFLARRVLVGDGGATAAVAAAAQLGKGFRDALAVGIGRQDAVLRRRVRPATPGELEMWSHVWLGTTGVGEDDVPESVGP